MTVGRIYPSSATPPPAGIMEVLLERAQRDCDKYKLALEEISNSITDWNESMVKEPAEDFIQAVKHRITQALNGN